MNKRRYLATLATAVLAVSSAACGNVTAGGFTGEATVVVSGDADTLSLAARPTAPTSFALSPALSSHEAEDAEGEIEVEFIPYLVTEDGGSIRLGTEEIQVQVDLRGRTETDVIDRQPIPARQYTALRLIFIEIEAQVEGLVIDGTEVPQVHVDFEDIQLEVTRPLDLDVAPGSSAELVIDLNTLAWLGAVDPLTGAVDEAVFASLLNVVVR